MNHWQRLISLIVILPLLMLAGCQPGGQTPPASTQPPAFVLTDAMTREDGQTGHVFWFVSGFLALDLGYTLEGAPAQVGNHLTPDLSASGVPAQALGNILNTLPLAEDSRRDESSRPTSGTGAAFSLSYNTAQDQENEVCYLLIHEGRLYILSDPYPGATGVSYAIQGGQEQAQAQAQVLDRLWAESEKMVYHVAVFAAQSQEVHPQSQVLKVLVTNDTAHPLTVREVTVQGKDTGEAVRLDSFAGTEMEEQAVLQIALEDLPDVSEGAAYEVRVTLTWQEGTPQAETVTFLAEVLITAQGMQLFRAPDPMTPRQLELYTQYVQPFQASLLYDKAFSEEQPLTTFHVYTLFYSSYIAQYNDYPKSSSLDYWYPGDFVEELIGRYYLLTPQQIRRNAPVYDPARGFDHEGYDAASHRYCLLGGLGGAYPYCQVDDARQSGDRMEIDYTMYSAIDDSVSSRATLTVRLLPHGGFAYLANQVTYRAQPN